jgi:hypothetical protein
MKISKLVGVLVVVLAFTAMVGTSTGSAAVNSVTPSTNDLNRANGWAHVDLLEVTQGHPNQMTFAFVSTRNFYSCFEYRTTSGRSQVITENGGVNYNSQVTDGLYPYVCVNNNTQQVTIATTQRVEIRMVFGAETDERFDWTRFDAN